LKKFKIKGTLCVSGIVSFTDKEQVLKNFRECIVSHWTIEDIAEHVLYSFARGNNFVEGVGEDGKDFEIEDYESYWEDSEIEVI